MFGNPSLATRIAVGKIIGFIIGLIGFFTLKSIMPDATLLRWGLLLWYTTFGAVIGVFGVITWHPVLKFEMTWWFRDALIGAWMNFVLAFFAYDQLSMVIHAFLGDNPAISSPFWIVLEGAIFGLLIGYFAKKHGGEGPKTADMKKGGKKKR